MADQRTCKHPPGFLHITDAGLNLTCIDCGLKRPLARWLTEIVMDPEGGPRMEAGAMEGVTLMQAIRAAIRLEFALRHMGRAFWHGDHNQQQETAMELAKDALDAFATKGPQMRAMLDEVAKHFPKAQMMDGDKK